MFCARCGADNPEGKSFCAACGAALTIPETVETVVVPRDPPAGSVPRMTGRIIEGKYRIDSVLNHGGMGVVYRATRVLIGDTVALKLMHSDRVQDAGSRDRFQREAQAAARLKHENAVTIYDFGVTPDGLVYLVMELVEGESLARIIDTRGALSVDQCLEVMKQVCAAVGEAHRHNIVHRDLKPDNIMICETGSAIRVKVLDFGIAKLQDPAASKLTQTGMVVGTPHYMSPEQCLGEKLDGRSDIYSLGIVIFEMLTGRVPFEATTPTAVVIQQVTQPPPSLRSINREISESVERAVLRAMAKKRDDRPQSADDFYRELTAAAASGQEPILRARPDLAAPAGTTEQAGAPAIASPAEPKPAPGQYGGPTSPNVKPQPTVGAGFSSAPGAPQPATIAYGQQGTVWPGHSYGAAPAPTSARMLAPAPRRNNRSALFVALVFGSLMLVVGAVLLILFALGRTSGTANSNTTLIVSTPPPNRPFPSQSPPVNLDAVANEVTDTLNEWASAVSARDINSLMSHYADQLQPYYLARSASASKVHLDMQRAYSNYFTTSITISNISVQPAADGLSATARFDKAFDFIGLKRYTGSVQEEMWLSKAWGRWLITGVADLRVYYSNSTPADEPTP